MTRARSHIVRQAVSRGCIATLVAGVLGLSWLGNAPGVSAAAAAPRGGSPERIAINDNRIAAGKLQNGVLTIRLEARAGQWHPDGDSDPGIVVHAFGEKGKPLQIPGPLIRVPKGTEIHAFVRNSLPDSTLFVRGLYTRGAAGSDTLQIKPRRGARGPIHRRRARDLLLLGFHRSGVPDRDSRARLTAQRCVHRRQLILVRLDT